jgi:DNA-binding transcriptional MerR regulator
MVEEQDKLIDSEVAAMLLGISKSNLRQLVLRKLLVPVGREKKRSMFQLQDIVKLQERKATTNTWKP